MKRAARATPRFLCRDPRASRASTDNTRHTSAGVTLPLVEPAARPRAVAQTSEFERRSGFAGEDERDDEMRDVGTCRLYGGLEGSVTKSTGPKGLPPIPKIAVGTEEQDMLTMISSDLAPNGTDALSGRRMSSERRGPVGRVLAGVDRRGRARRTRGGPPRGGDGTAARPTTRSRRRLAQGSSRPTAFCSRTIRRSRRAGNPRDVQNGGRIQRISSATIRTPTSPSSRWTICAGVRHPRRFIGAARRTTRRRDRQSARLQATVTAGVVSALGRTMRSESGR